MITGENCNLRRFEHGFNGLNRSIRTRIKSHIMYTHIRENLSNPFYPRSKNRLFYDFKLHKLCRYLLFCLGERVGDDDLQDVIAGSHLFADGQRPCGF